MLDTLQNIVTRFFGAAATAKALVIDQGKSISGSKENADMPTENDETIVDLRQISLVDSCAALTTSVIRLLSV
jgi:hypothetical protein